MICSSLMAAAIGLLYIVFNNSVYGRSLVVASVSMLFLKETTTAGWAWLKDIRFAWFYTSSSAKYQKYTNFNLCFQKAFMKLNHWNNAQRRYSNYQTVISIFVGVIFILALHQSGKFVVWTSVWHKRRFDPALYRALAQAVSGGGRCRWWHQLLL